MKQHDGQQARKVSQPVIKQLVVSEIWVQHGRKE